MKVVVWASKHDTITFDASTPEKELKAFLNIFNEMDEAGDYECCPPEGRQIALYSKAKSGDMIAAKSFLLMRKDYEYENVYYDEVRDPK